MIFCGQTAYVLLDVGHGIFLGRELRCAFSTFVLFEYVGELAILLGSRCARIFHEVLNKVPLTLFVESQHHAITPAAMGYFSNGPLRPGRDRFRPSGSPVTYFSPVAPKTLPGPIQSSSAVSVATPRTMPSYRQRPTWPNHPRCRIGPPARRKPLRPLQRPEQFNTAVLAFLRRVSH
jgi:hypothetical protein